LHSPSPTLGEHNEEVLSEVGLTSDELASLRDSGILGERVAGAE
jgi:crotonobetainyl-CoA:carnitine CoA-transferase CaiB-like acyl-CoA transferase